MKNKNVIEIPKRAVSPMLDDRYVITYYENSKDANNDKNLKELKLPMWLVELIMGEVMNESEKAVNEFKKEVAEMFKC